MEKTIDEKKKRMPTPADGLVAGADGAIASIVSIVDIMHRKGCSTDQIRATLYAMSDDDVSARPIAALCLKHLSMERELTDAQMHADFVVLIKDIATNLRLKGVDIGFDENTLA